LWIKIYLMDIRIIIGIVLVLIVIWMYMRRKNMIVVPAIMVPAPVVSAVGGIPQDTTNSLLTSPADGDHYATSPAASATTPAATTAINSAPVVSTPATVAPVPITIDIPPPPAMNTTDVPNSSDAPASTTVLVVPTVPPISTSAPTSAPTTVKYSYLGCYKDASTRALPIMVPALTISECQALAKANGSAYFGMQWPEGSPAGKAQCFYGNGIYSRYGSAGICNMKDNDGNKLGGIWANAVYKV
jgi:hypothetical protein